MKEVIGEEEEEEEEGEKVDVTLEEKPGALEAVAEGKIITGSCDSDRSPGKYGFN